MINVNKLVQLFWLAEDSYLKSTQLLAKTCHTLKEVSCIVATVRILQTRLTSNYSANSYKFMSWNEIGPMVSSKDRTRMSGSCTYNNSRVMHGAIVYM